MAYHREHPDAAEGRFIVHPGTLPRDRTNDICGQCHAGTGIPLGAAFRFRPGDRIADYVAPDTNPAHQTSKPGVHTNNQLQRLEKSACYDHSPSMSCATCHDPHQNEAGNRRVFAARCQSCHDISDCSMNEVMNVPGVRGELLGDYCVDCHMPTRDVRSMVLRTNEGSTALMMRDHFIQARISREELDGVIREIQKADEPTAGDAGR